MTESPVIMARPAAQPHAPRDAGGGLLALLVAVLTVVVYGRALLPDFDPGMNGFNRQTRLEAATRLLGPRETPSRPVRIGLHAVSAVMLLHVLRRCGANDMAAALGAAVFALHPMQVEAVLDGSHARLLLAGFCGLAAIAAHLRMADSRHAAWAWLVAATSLYLIGLSAHPIILPLPAVLLLLDRWPLDRPNRRAWLEKTPMIGAAAGVILRAIVSLGSRVSDGPADSVQSWPAQAAAQVLMNLGSIVQRMVMPAWLAPYTPRPDGAAGWLLACGGGVALLSLAIAWTRSTIHRAAARAIAAILFLALVPAMAAAGDVGLAPNRFAYLATAAAAAALSAAITIARRPAWLQSWFSGRSRAPGILMGLMALACNDQIYAWRGLEPLLRHQVACHPGDPRGLARLAAYLTAHANDGEAGRHDCLEAVKILERAVAVAPDNAAVRVLLGNVWDRLGRLDEATRAYEAAVRLDARSADAQRGLAAALAEAKRFDAAVPHFELARELDPDSASTRIGLGYAYLRIGRPASARAELQEGLLLKPNDALVHMGLACAWAMMQTPDQARAHLAAAVALNPSMAAQAGREPALRELADRPGFEGLIRREDRSGASSPPALAPAGRVREDGRV